jgi:hypothetical protein
MHENAQEVNRAQSASTSDGVARPNEMTRDEFLRRVLYSGEITKLAQHIALVICLLAEKGSVHASVRDLERITGWTRQAIRDHLGELQMFMKVTLGVGRSKTHFELQGALEDAFATAIVSGAMVRRVDAKADAKLVAKEVDANSGQPARRKPVVANHLDAVVAKEVDTAKESFPPYPPSKKTINTQTAHAHATPPKGDFTELGHGAYLNCRTIWHPKFSISLAAAKMQFGLNPETAPLDSDAICKAAALQWAAAIEGGQNPDKVVPGNIIGALMGGARKGVYSGIEHKARMAKVGPKPFKPSRFG